MEDKNPVESNVQDYIMQASFGLALAKIPVAMILPKEVERVFNDRQFSRFDEVYKLRVEKFNGKSVKFCAVYMRNGSGYVGLMIDEQNESKLEKAAQMWGFESYLEERDPIPTVLPKLEGKEFYRIAKKYFGVIK